MTRRITIYLGELKHGLKPLYMETIDLAKDHSLVITLKARVGEGLTLKKIDGGK